VTRGDLAFNFPSIATPFRAKTNFTKRPRPILILLAVILLGCAALFFIGPKEPKYQGKTLTQWLYHEFPRLSNGSYLELVGDRVIYCDDETDGAIVAIGTNGLPVLLRLLGARDGAIKTGFMKFANRQSVIKMHVHSAHEKHQAALLGFCWLGSNALSAVPELIKLTGDDNAEVREDALVCLWCASWGKASRCRFSRTICSVPMRA
jgi:hypothetical protein